MRKKASVTENEQPKEPNKTTRTERPKPKPALDVTKILYMREELKCKNKTQKDLINLINEKEIVIAAGPAGVGKSYVAIARALELLKNTSNTFNTIILSKPAVEADENHGFIPGTLREKMEPYIASSLDIIDKIIGKANRLRLEEMEVILVQPLAFIRGKSIDNTLLIMEEAQNMTPQQMKTLLTRIGTGSKFIISGDLDQSDKYKDYRQSGLYDAMNRHKNVEEIGFITFSEDEIVRNKVITKILGNYKRDIEAPKKPAAPTPPADRHLQPKKKSWIGKMMKKIKNFFK